MTGGDIPVDVQRRIYSHINSVEQLEVLLLARARADQAWNGESVAQERRVDPAPAAGRLEDLEARGFLVAAGDSGTEYRYRPRDSTLDQTVGGLAQAYKERRFGVINLIFSKPLDNIRTFSDAFK